MAPGALGTQKAGDSKVENFVVHEHRDDHVSGRLVHGAELHSLLGCNKVASSLKLSLVSKDRGVRR